MVALFAAAAVTEGVASVGSAATDFAAAAGGRAFGSAADVVDCSTAGTLATLLLLLLLRRGVGRCCVS